MAMFELRLVLICLLFRLCFSEDASKYVTLELSYITASPLGVPQKVLHSFSTSLTISDVLLVQTYGGVCVLGF